MSVDVQWNPLLLTPPFKNLSASPYQKHSAQDVPPVFQTCFFFDMILLLLKQTSELSAMIYNGDNSFHRCIQVANLWPDYFFTDKIIKKQQHLPVSTYKMGPPEVTTEKR